MMTSKLCTTVFSAVCGYHVSIQYVNLVALGAMKLRLPRFHINIPHPCHRPRADVRSIFVNDISTN